MPFDLVLPLQIALVAACVWFGWRRSVALAKGGYHPLNVVTVVHCWFAGAGVVMQWIWGYPNYQVFLHLSAVNQSRVTWIAYCVSSICTCILFNAFARVLDRRGSTADDPLTVSDIRFNARRRDKVLLWGGLVSPVVIAFFSPDSRIWSQYAVMLDLQPNAELATFVNLLYWSTYVSVLTACGLILAVRGKAGWLLPITPFLGAALWFNGKRNIVILATILVLLSLRIRNILPNKLFFATTAAGVLGFLSYSHWYQGQFRPILSSFDTYYEMARMDFARDADVRMALFAELEQGANPILEYRGQTLLFDLLFFVPRSAWELKPLPYYYYITATALHEPRVYRTWGIGTTFLGEAIANVGLAGLLFGPLFIIALAIIGHSQTNPFLSIFTSVICTLYLSIHLAGFTVLWAAWGIFLVNARFSRHRDTHLAALALPEAEYFDDPRIRAPHASNVAAPS